MLLQYIVLYKTKRDVTRRAEYFVMNAYHIMQIRANLYNAGCTIIKDEQREIDLPVLVSDTRVSSYAMLLMEQDDTPTYAQVM